MRSREKSQFVYVWTSDGEFVGVYENACQAAYILKVPRTSVYDCCNGVCRLAGRKYICRYDSMLEDQEQPDGGYIRPWRTSKPVGQYTLSGELVRTYKSLSDAAFETGFDKSNIAAACRGRLKTCKGYIWSYI